MAQVQASDGERGGSNQGKWEGAQMGTRHRGGGWGGLSLP
jgi:hypothetical protein